MADHLKFLILTHRRTSYTQPCTLNAKQFKSKTLIFPTAFAYLLALGPLTPAPITEGSSSPPISQTLPTAKLIRKTRPMLKSASIQNSTLTSRFWHALPPHRRRSSPGAVAGAVPVEFFRCDGSSEVVGCEAAVAAGGGAVAGLGVFAWWGDVGSDGVFLGDLLMAEEVLKLVDRGRDVERVMHRAINGWLGLFGQVNPQAAGGSIARRWRDSEGGVLVDFRLRSSLPSANIGVLTPYSLMASRTPSDSRSAAW
ncbi:hypothetical protein KC326_g19 [Hortaea werneckii]|nr:hypothetical protein KC326_g19 [Hortaea werneckii]